MERGEISFFYLLQWSHFFDWTTMCNYCIVNKVGHVTGGESYRGAPGSWMSSSLSWPGPASACWPARPASSCWPAVPSCPSAPPSSDSVCELTAEDVARPTLVTSGISGTWEWCSQVRGSDTVRGTSCPAWRLGSRSLVKCWRENISERRLMTSRCRETAGPRDRRTCGPGELSSSSAGEEAELVWWGTSSTSGSDWRTWSCPGPCRRTRPSACPRPGRAELVWASASFSSSSGVAGRSKTCCPPSTSAGRGRPPPPAACGILTDTNYVKYFPLLSLPIVLEKATDLDGLDWLIF